jgi:hypothetical protein
MICWKVLGGSIGNLQKSWSIDVKNSGIHSQKTDVSLDSAQRQPPDRIAARRSLSVGLHIFIARSIILLLLEAAGYSVSRSSYKLYKELMQAVGTSELRIPLIRIYCSNHCQYHFFVLLTVHSRRTSSRCNSSIIPRAT